MKRISTAIDYLTNRYETFVALGDDIAVCYAIRKLVFGDELKRARVSSRYCPALQDEFDRKSMHLACRDTKTGEIVGTIRLTPAHLFKGNAKFEKEYGLRHFPPGLLPRIVIASRLAVLKEHRAQGNVGLSLCVGSYERGLDSYPISCIVCEPHLYPMYRRLGYRPLDRVQVSPFGGYRLPLFLISHDYEYLSAVKSPFFAIAKKKKFPTATEGKRWYYRFLLEQGHVATSYSVVPEERTSEYHSSLTASLSEKGKRLILKNAIEIQCKFGDVVLAKGTGGRTLGFVRKGALEVSRGKKLRVILGEGDVFGEVGFILDVPRTANVVAAAKETEIVLLSLSAIEKLEDPADQVQVWRNLAKLLARRLSTTHP